MTKLSKRQILSHLIEDVRSWPINKLSADREALVMDVVEVTRKRILERHDNIEDLVGRCMLQELARIKHNPWKVDPPNDKIFWKRIQSSLATLPEPVIAREEKLLELLNRIIRRYAEEIVGDFRPKTFLFARKFLTVLFKMIFTSFNTGKFGFWGNRKTLMKHIHTIGPLEHIRKLYQIGHVILVPTHSSNLDSIFVGYAIDSKTGMPAFMYGAGLNLFNSEILAYYMNRLGTYRVDRRKKSSIYLETLKTMSRQSIMNGINQLFFPGGTRSRSGKIEQKLKLGLMNTTVEAQRIHLTRNAKKKVFIVPVVISYSNVLEGKALIDQQLKREGREKYITRGRKIAWYKWGPLFIRDIFRATCNGYLSFGHPLDIIGNPVDESGRSLDSDGNVILIEEYFTNEDGDINTDLQRESVYTKALGRAVADAYLKYNPVQPGHVMAYAAFEILSRRFRAYDFFELFKLNKVETEIMLDEFRTYTTRLLDTLDDLEKAGGLILTFDAKSDLDELIDRGIRDIGNYHYNKPLRKYKDNYIFSEDVPLLYFYRNRLNSYMDKS